MPVGEILLSAFFTVLFDRLASRDLLNFVRQLQGGVDSELKKWEDTLIMIRAVLSDAEEKQLTDRAGAVNIWLDDLRDLAYDAEDILDEFTTEALKRKLKEQVQDQASTSKIHNCFPAKCINCFNSSNMRMDSEIKSITNRFEQLRKKITLLGLQGNTGRTSAAAPPPAPYRPPSSSVPTERAVYGRDEDKANILKLVLSDESSDANFLVIPIVGMAGIGKTTLAREVYNDKMIDDFKFDKKGWVCVSDVFDVLSISKAILESITSATCNLKALNEVQVQLREVVDSKKVLLVLDDVWNEDYNLWEVLQAPFLAAAPNSKIIVTTRHSRVASTMGPIDHYNLKHLSDDDCWSLFMKHAFEGRDINGQQISEIRNKVVGKCGGLPLAAKTLGGLLRSNRGDAWHDILNSNILNFSQQNGILPVLQLSYHYLPSHLKRCFAYCALFPKDYEFNKKELVLLWMAEGIVQQSRNDKQIEDWGNHCFDDLVSRSIFQQSNSDSAKFIMHDLVHDLAQMVSGETIFRLEEANKSLRRFERIRHSSYTQDLYEGQHKFENFYKVEYLRTFLPVLIRGGFHPSYISYAVLHDLLPKLKKLRVISLRGYQITQLPDSIEDLRLLSYLNLAGTMIRCLPESTCSLFNLQILILRDCSRLIKLPSKMRNLINLYHLDLEGANLLKEMPFGMKQLKNLQKLSNFIVGKGATVSGLNDLKNLKFLRGELCISGLENLTDSKDARETALCGKLNLEALSLQWGSQFDNSRDEALEENVIDILQPHKNIQRLTITNYGGARFPIWIGDPLFSKMEVLTLENGENCKSLPSLGMLGSLKHLTIKRFTKLKIINSEIYGKGCSKPFQSLETLRFEYLPEWECWDTIIKENENVEVFSCLRELSIVRSPKLSGKLPELVPSLETLVVSKCAELVVSFSSYPMLCKLEVDECKGMVCRSSSIDSKSIKCVTISNSALNVYGCNGMLYNGTTELLKSVILSNLLEFGKFIKQGFLKVDTLATGDSVQRQNWRFQFKKQVQGLHLLTYPEEIAIEENCVSLVSFPEINFLPNNLRSLLIGNNDALKSMPEEMMGNNSQLEWLHLSRCNSLTFITRGKLPSSLKKLEIVDCQNLQRLVDDDVKDASSSFSSVPAEMMGNNSQLESLSLSRCNSLTFITRGKLPSSLKELVIVDCQNLQRLVDDDVKDASSSFSSLVTLKDHRIYNFPKLTTFSSGIQLLEALESLSIYNCPKFESLPDGMHNLNCLRHISIRKCPSLVYFPDRGLPSTISVFEIRNCENLKALPDDMHNLNSLRKLEISGCPNVVSFPEEGFPTSLTSLVIEDHKIYKALIQWGFHRLTSLEALCLGDGDYNEAESFLDEEMGMMLPTSLIDLTILGFPKLKYLSSTGFQNLTSLVWLRILECPKLKSFPELGLPSSLLFLEIGKCPLLKKKCKRDKGKEWSKISHIPWVRIDYKFIFEE